jgi:hypothetical protein
MDMTPLQKWLSLPSGAWPPDDRTLLGLSQFGFVDAATAEQNALERMELLRPHQLVHPDLVTEGMNRLAQALIAVTTPSASPPAQMPPESASAPTGHSFAPEVQGDEVEVMEAEVVTVSAFAPQVQRPAPQAAPVVELVDEPHPVVVPADAVPSGLVVGVPENRRIAYRELVCLRKLRRVWDRLGPLAGSPNEPLQTPEAIYQTLTTSQELRELLRWKTVTNTLQPETGRRVTSIFSQPHSVKILRDLTPEQRGVVAADWVAGKSAIDARYAELRSALQSSKPQHATRTLTRRTAAFLRANPEWILGVLTLLLTLIGLVRLLTRSTTTPGS